MMTRWIQNVLGPLQRGDELLANGMQRLLRESQASTPVAWALRESADRWRRTMRAMDAAAGVAEALRGSPR